MLKSLLLLAILCGCSSRWANNYTPLINAYEAGPHTGITPCEAAPDGHKTQSDPVEVLRYYVTHGYYPVGYSHFYGTSTDFSLAIKHGEEVGACIVVVGDRLVETRTSTFLLPRPDKIETTTTVGRLNVNGESVAYEETTKEYLPQEPLQIPYTYNYKMYFALFLVEWKPILGVHLVALDETTRKSLGHNTGCRVEQIVRNSPAWKVGIQEGDILLSVNGQQVTSPDQAQQLLYDARNSTVELLLMRETKEISKTVYLHQ